MSRGEEGVRGETGEVGVDRAFSMRQETEEGVRDETFHPSQNDLLLWFWNRSFWKASVFATR